jgi:monoterpene epsilon-lactone hydrolase
MPAPGTLLSQGLPPRRPGHAANPDLLTRRAAIRGLSGVASRDQVTIGAICCAIAESPHPRAILVHCHGGGYRHGSASDWAAFGERLALATDTIVLTPDYALAPEHPFPAAIHDIADVLAALVGDVQLPILLSGDSAGGGLALAAAAALARPMPLTGIALFSAWLDLRLTADSYRRCADSDAIFSHAAASVSASAYLQGESASSPLASPLLASFDGFPPVMLQASAAEVLVDDSVTLARELAIAGIPCTLHVESDLPHVWPVTHPDLPASRRALARVAHLVDHVASATATAWTRPAPWVPAPPTETAS